MNKAMTILLLGIAVLLPSCGDSFDCQDSCKDKLAYDFRVTIGVGVQSSDEFCAQAEIKSAETCEKCDAAIKAKTAFDGTTCK
jgi:hypothetical protein